MSNCSTETRLDCMSVTEARSFYAGLGLDTMPTLGNSKIACVRNWPNLDPGDMWGGAPEDANIAIRAGGRARVAILDFDDKEIPGTAERGVAWLALLGYRAGDYPLIQTASGVGRQAYITLVGALPRGSYRKLNPKFGAGELRYGSGAYVLAPPSVVGRQRYRILSGDISRRPSLQVRDLSALLQPHYPDLDWIAPFEVPLTRRISRYTWTLLATPGRGHYLSRSEKEQAILTGLANAGRSFDEVLELFQRYPAAGRFAEDFAANPDRACRWLKRSFQKAVLFTSSTTSGARRAAEQAIRLAEHTAWPGKAGIYDKLTYLAHADIAYRAGRHEYAASARDLAMLAGISPEACMHATNRLRQRGLIRLVRKWIADRANVYLLVSQSLALPHSR